MKDNWWSGVSSSIEGSIPRTPACEPCSKLASHAFLALRTKLRATHPARVLHPHEMSASSSTCRTHYRVRGRTLYAHATFEIAGAHTRL